MGLKRPLVMTAGAIERLQSTDTLDPVCGPFAGPNVLINGGFDFFQRTDPATLTNASDDTYGSDRWTILTQTAAIQHKRVAAGPNSAQRVDLKQTQAAAQRFGLVQIVESVNSVPLTGKTIYANAQVYLSGSQAVRIAILEWTGTADTVTSDVVNDWTSGTYTAGNFFLASNLTVTAIASVTPSATTWTALGVSGTVSANCKNLIVLVWTEGTAAQNFTMDVAEADCYVGSAARSWNPRSIAQELILCQRYYEKSYDRDTVPGTVTGNGAGNSGIMTTYLLYAPIIRYQVSKRVAATPVAYSDKTASTTGVMSEYNTASVFVADRAAIFGAQGNAGCYIQGSAGNLTVNNFCRWQWTIDAEL